MTSRLSVHAIADDDVPESAQYLHDRLNSRVSVDAWMELLRPPWHPAGDRGFALRRDGRLVGVYAAVRSERAVGAQVVPVCNLAAFCVDDGERAQGLRLVRALLADKQGFFTDLSPSGNVVALNERLGFRRLDPRASLTLNLPRAPRRGIRLSEDPEAIATALSPDDRRIHRDHLHARAARHLLIEGSGSYAYLVYRRDRRKRLPLFATPLYVGGDRDLLRRAWPIVRGRLAGHGLIFTLSEPRLLGFSPPLSIALTHPRARMVRGNGWPDDAVDYLYSEFALVSW